MRELTATRNAILGHLALREWSAYELTRSLRRTVHWFWPRAESIIYAEVKKLEHAGLAERRQEATSSGSARVRAIYSITAKGRRMLSAWLATPSSRIALDLEPLLRLHLARFGEKDDLLSALELLNGTARELLADAAAVATEFSEGRHVLQDEAHIRGLLFDCLYSLGRALEASAAGAKQEVGRWTTLDGSAAAKLRGVERMRAALVELEDDGFVRRRHTPKPG